MERVQRVLQAANQLAKSEELEQFVINAQDFVSQRGQSGDSVTTQLSQMVVSLGDAAEVMNRSFGKPDSDGREAKVISPVVMPRGHRSWGWVAVALGGLLFGIFGLASVLAFDGLLAFVLPYWVLWVLYIAFNLWKNSYVMIPDGCQALISKYGRVEAEVGPGRHWIFHPRKQVSYIINVEKEYPYNAPIREAPTQDRVNASVDLFLQFKINNPQKFIFELGGVNGFSEKLQNAISEVTRALIYAQRAEDIYDLVGESTSDLLDSLNEQFMPAVNFVSANITHAEPSSQEYRMDLAAAEMVRVAKEAYTYQYELELRKRKDQGDLDKDLAGLRETLSGIKAEIATYKAQIETAYEKEINRANAYAQQLMIEAESAAQANAAMLQAQALDIRALRGADYPEILEYRYQQQVLDRIESVAGQLPQLIQVGDAADTHIDFMALGRQMLGVPDKPLYSAEDLVKIRGRKQEIMTRIKRRAGEIQKVDMAVETNNVATAEEVLSE
ncbi:MAG: SPFH domain-containing protein [Chloroflexi bacterium]|nr:SPFH domain-containing protein [Chloroflexota bacterium]